MTPAGDATPSRVIHGVRILLLQGDITEQRVDAIVNAANTSLLGGGGVDGAIHRRGGPAILAECRVLHDQGGCPTGHAVVTTAGNLSARHVVHTVGPVWSGGERGEEALLRAAYRSSLERACEHGARTVAFPSISTGAYRYPIGEASRVALDEVRRFVSSRGSESCRGRLEEVRFVLFSPSDHETYQAALDQLPLGGSDAARSRS